MRSPQTTGVEPAGPQWHLPGDVLVGLHSVGRFFSVLIPLLDGPRQLGQFSAMTEPDTDSARATAYSDAEQAT